MCASPRWFARIGFKKAWTFQLSYIDYIFILVVVAKLLINIPWMDQLAFCPALTWPHANRTAQWSTSISPLQPRSFASLKLPRACARCVAQQASLRMSLVTNGEQVFIRVEGQVNARAIQLAQMELDARRLLHAARQRDAELSIVLCDDETIQSLNEQWRGKNAPTDVLSFPQPWDSEDLSTDRSILGDVVISESTAERQAKERNHSLRDELRILLVHGLLHLLGYDHEESESAYVEMSEAEMKLLKRLEWKGEGLIKTSEMESSSTPAEEAAAPSACSASSETVWSTMPTIQSENAENVSNTLSTTKKSQKRGKKKH